ncbi:hypothetical protein SH661x_002858 [Planctomicrobium sp. SH661]|uniref:hypothetical protein n=1 Tax=Planctomicrobium sp. SH661 TaxID=3448124 RepID=UPI003F5C715B
MSIDPQSFDDRKFFNECSRDFSSVRLKTVKYAYLAASPEHWFQVEGLSCLNTHCGTVGLAGGTTAFPAWHALYERRKTAPTDQMTSLL